MRLKNETGGGVSAPAGLHAFDPRTVLAFAWVYRAFRRLVARDRCADVFVRDYVRPRDGDRVLDIGCGPGVMLAQLPNVDYTGVEPSERYVHAARALAGSRARFVVGSARSFELADSASYDLVLAVAVLHHLDDREARDLLELGSRALCPGGRLVTLDCCYVPGQSWASRVMVSMDRGRHVRVVEEYRKLIAEFFPAVSCTIRHDLLRVPYTHVIAEASRQ